MAKKKFPKQLYVQIDGDEDDEFFNSVEYPNDAHDGKVAIYELKEFKTKITNVELR